MNPPPPFPLLLILVYAVWLSYLVLAKRRILMREPHRLDQLWKCWPMTLFAYLTSQYDLQPMAMGGPRDLSDSYRSLVFAMPIAGFGLLLVSELFTWLFASLGPARAFANLRHPVMSVHLITFLYYVFEPGTESCIMWDAFGRPLHPLRYVMWTISVSAMCLSLFLIVENILQQSKESRSLSREQLRDKLINALLYCYGTFVLGFLGSRLAASGTLMPNYGLFCASTAFFYMMLYELTSMLSHVIRSPRIVQAGTAPQFHAIRAAVVITWHIFPVVWLLGAFNVITVFQEHAGYVICDMCAKYLLLFVYISHVNA
jgi:bacteriorhodopsin